MDALGEQMKLFKAAPGSNSIARFLQEIYAVRTIRPTDPSDRRFLAVANAVRDALDELDDPLFDQLHFAAPDRLPLRL